MSRDNSVNNSKFLYKMVLMLELTIKFFYVREKTNTYINTGLKREITNRSITIDSKK